jgi:uncharacterized delta-60 repeat protein
MFRTTLLTFSLLIGWAAAAPGDLETAFNPDADDEVWTIALQGDGKIIVGGWFDNIGGGWGGGFARLNTNGTKDAGFPGPVYLDTTELSKSCAVLPDGSILSGRRVRAVNNVGYSFAKFTSAGVVDESFSGATGLSPHCMLLQDDGKIIAGGQFRNVYATGRNYLIRVNANGTLDTTFNPNIVGTNAIVYTMAWQTDGKILIGGDNFTTVGGAARTVIARLNPDGSNDTAFNPSITGTDVLVTSLAVQPDGKIIVGGHFSSAGGQTRRNLARLNPNGTVDSAFASPFPADFGFVYTSAVLTDGRIALGGSLEFTDVVTRNGFIMVNSNGTLDTGVTSVGGSTYGMAVQADGRILRCGPGGFGTQALHRDGVARVAGYPATQLLSAASPSRVRWMRGGGSPEVLRVKFELSTNGGTVWTNLGEATRIPGGWERSGLTLPLTGRLRARAAVPQGMGNGSVGWMESTANFVLAPEIALHNGAADTAPQLIDGQTQAVDFGTVRQGSPAERPLTIVNAGNSDLVLTTLTLPAGFSVTGLPQFPAALGPGLSLTFQLILDAASPGTSGGTVILASNDSNESLFDFPVAGQVVTPEITVRDGSAAGPELADGQAAPVDFGRNVQGTPAVRSFTIGNNGTAELLVSGITVPAGFTAVNAPVPPLSLGIGQSATFQVSLTTLTVGAHTGRVTIISDDLDEGEFDFPVAGEVLIPEPVATVPSDVTTILNRQTGLREQTIRIANDTTATVPAYNLIIRGLPDGVEVNNASERRPDGSWVVYVRQAMIPHSTQDILVEYFSVNRGPGDIAPQLSTEVVLNPPDLSVPGDAGFAIDQVRLMEGGAVLIEFPTTPGRQYQVQYSHDGTNWQASLPNIRAAANRTQWMDRGLPRTDSHPSAHVSRFYRVAELAP